MTQRICIIGDSHVGALKLGWPRIFVAYPKVAISFFAAAHGAMDALTVANGELVPTTDGLRAQLKQTSGEEKIVGSYDLYIVCGLQFQIKTALERFLQGWRSARTSNGFLDDVTTGLRDTVAVRTVQKLRRCTEAPVLMIATPFKPDPSPKVFWDLARVEARDIAIVFDKACRRMAKRHGRQKKTEPT